MSRKSKQVQIVICTDEDRDVEVLTQHWPSDLKEPKISVISVRSDRARFDPDADVFKVVVGNDSTGRTPMAAVGYLTRPTSWEKHCESVALLEPAAVNRTLQRRHDDEKIEVITNRVKDMLERFEGVFGEADSRTPEKVELCDLAQKLRGDLTGLNMYLDS